MRHEPEGALAELDRRTLPLVARGLRGVGHGFRAVAGPEGTIGRWVAPWIRRDPVIVVAVGCVAFAAILIAATGGDNHGAVRAVNRVGPVLTSPHLLGPVTGTSVSSYRTEAATRRGQLESLAASQQDEAVVDLTGYATPQAVYQLLAATPGVAVLRAFVRVPPPQQAAVHVLVTSTSADIATGLSDAMQTAKSIALHYERELDREIVHPTPQLQAAIAAGAAQAAQARLDAAGLSPTCSCVFAVVVSGPVGQLQQLAAQAAVRILDPAPVRASLTSLMIVPLEPQVTDVVPPIDFAGE